MAETKEMNSAEVTEVGKQEKNTDLNVMLKEALIRN